MLDLPAVGNLIGRDGSREQPPQEMPRRGKSFRSLLSRPSSGNQAAELGLRVAGKDVRDLAVAEMPHHQFTQHVAEIGGQVQVAPFVELFALHAGPFAVDSCRL